MVFFKQKCKYFMVSASRICCFLFCFFLFYFLLFELMKVTQIANFCSSLKLSNSLLGCILFVFCRDSFPVACFESVYLYLYLNKMVTKVIWSLGVYVATTFHEIKMLKVMECYVMVCVWGNNNIKQMEKITCILFLLHYGNIHWILPHLL